MKLISTVYELNHLKDILKIADAIILGHHSTGTRLTRSFTHEEIKTAVKTATSLHKEIFIQANQIFNDQQLEHFENEMKKLPLSDITGVVVADLGAYRILEKLGFVQKAIYNPETLLTNVHDFNFLADFNLFGVYIAKEITLEDILEIGKHKKYHMFMVGHGHLNMFYSKRQLIQNFTTYTNEAHLYHEQQNLKIIEENRSDEAYPILEDDAGTHVFRSHVFQSLSHLSDIEKVVDYLVIDTIFKDDSYALKVLELYKNKQENIDIISGIKSAYHESWDDGFFYKKTIYKSKGSL